MNQNASIGIVENDEGQRVFIEKLFSTDEKFQLKCFSSGEEFLDSLRTHDFDLVYVDLHLNDMSGIDLIERAVAVDTSIQTVIQSSLSDEDSFFRALRTGAVGYLWKADMVSLRAKNEIFLSGGSLLDTTMAFRIHRFLLKNHCDCEEGLEKIIIEMLTRGYTVEKIQEKEGLSQQQIYLAMRGILTIFQKCNE